MSIPGLDELNRRAREKKRKQAALAGQDSRPKPSVEENKNLNTYRAQGNPNRPFAPTEGNNFLTDRLRDWGNFIGELAPPTWGRRNVIGAGYGDFLLGSNPNDRASGRLGQFRDGSRPGSSSKAVRGFMSKTGGAGPQPEAQLTLSDYLKQAIEMIGNGGGGGGIPGVNYDPQRGELRQRADENDARLEAMYRQLRGSIDADAPVIQQAYDTALDSTRQNASDAQMQTQAATDAANARNSEVLANLGIQQAQGNIIQQGNDLNTQTAQRIADQATKGQAASDRLVSNQATALDHNTNIGNAAGLEGNLQRASNSARLQALLAEIDMQEQQQNQQIAAQNASMSQRNMGDSIGLAQWLYGQDVDERRYQDQMSAAEQAAQAAQGQQALPSLQGYLDALGINQTDLAKNPRDWAPLLTALTKYQ